MKNFRQFCAAVVLTFTLALPAFAGNMSTPVVTPPPPAAAGDMSFPATAPEPASAGWMGCGITLNLLQTMLSII